MKNKKMLIVVGLFILAMSIFAEENMTHYVTDNLRLRSDSSLNSAVITTLPQYTALRILENGKSETISGVTAPWIKVISQTGYEGWCFSAYITQIEEIVANNLALSFADVKADRYPGDRDFSPKSGVTSIDEIRKVSGYYIQQSARYFQGHTPEILTLSVENQKVYVREIDVVNGQRTIRNEIILQFNGTTFTHYQTKLEKRRNKIQILYLEYPVQPQSFSSWNYEDGYTFAGALNAPMPDVVRCLTSDYLKTFAGKYVFDSYKEIISEHEYPPVMSLKKAVIEIAYNREKKCLTVPSNTLTDIYYRYNDERSADFDFVETVPAEPFYWYHGDRVGFTEARFYFYKGGIAFTYEGTDVSFEDNGEVEYLHIKYVVFFKKVRE
jgi:hypothetical protein